MDLYIVRHAPVINKTGMIYGDEADVDLDNHEEVISGLANILPPPGGALWVYSGIERALLTARAVLKRMNIDQADIACDPGFREQDFGDLIGRSHEDVKEYLQFIDGKIFTQSPPNGESILAFVDRVGKAITQLKERAIQENIKQAVIFSHGGTIRAAHAYLNSLGEDGFIALDTPNFYMYRNRF